MPSEVAHCACGCWPAPRDPLGAPGLASEVSADGRTWLLLMDGLVGMLRWVSSSAHWRVSSSAHWRVSSSAHGRGSGPSARIGPGPAPAMVDLSIGWCRRPTEGKGPSSGRGWRRRGGLPGPARGQASARVGGLGHPREHRAGGVWGTTSKPVGSRCGARDAPEGICLSDVVGGLVCPRAPGSTKARRRAETIVVSSGRWEAEEVVEARNVAVSARLLRVRRPPRRCLVVIGLEPWASLTT